MRNFDKLKYVLLILGICGLLVPKLQAQNISTASITDLRDKSDSFKTQTKSLKTVLGELEKHYQVYLNYNVKVVQGKTVMFTPEYLSNKSFESSLSALLAPFNLSFRKVENNYYVIFEKSETPNLNEKNKKSSSKDNEFEKINSNPLQIGRLDVNKEIHLTQQNVSFQERTISGRITSNAGEGLAGVNIIVKGTTIGTITDVDGKYQLNSVPNDKNILIFSFVGYVSQEVEIGNRSEVSITLQEDIQALQELVVIGYGTVLKQDLTNAVAKVDPKDIPKAANPNVTDLLFGKAAGVQVTQQSSQPGGEVNLSIRGRGNPLIVVDGILMPRWGLEPGVNFNEINNVRRSGLAGLNPDDIESIEFLKDASAAMYGVEAGNGVLVITTKKGKEGRMSISYNASRSWQRNMSYLEPLNASQYMTHYNRFQEDRYLAVNNMQPFGNVAPSGFTPKFSDTEIANPAHNTNWVDEILRNGAIDNHSISINGGTEKVTYMVSGNFFNQVGTVKNSDMTKYNGRVNLSMKPHKLFTINTNLIANKNKFNNTVAGWQTGGAGNEGYTALQAALAYPSYLPIKNPNTGQYSSFEMIGNPVSLLDIQDKTEYTSLFATLSLDINIIPDVLTAKLLYGNNTESSDRKFFIPSTTRWYGSYMSRASVQEAKRQFQTMETYISFKKNVTDFLKIDAVAGFGEYIYDENGFGSQAQGMLDVVGTDNINAGTEIPVVNSYKSKNKKRSYFVRSSFDFLDRYIVSASYRYDGYSQFFPESKYTGFPSVSVGWKLSNESFLSNVKFLNLLKLRASYGTTGNLLPNGAAYGAFWPDADYVTFDDGGTLYVPYVLGQIDHPNLTWEKTINKSIGLDFEVFNGRLSGSIDWFRDDVTNRLNGSAVTPALSQIATQPVNGGHQVRSGIELALKSTNIRNDNFEWTSMLNVSHYKARWEERFKEDDLGNFVGVKDPINAIYRWESNGILQLGQEVPAWQPVSESAQSHKAGAPIFVDRNGDGTLDSADVKMYDLTPKVTFGLGNTVRYKGFDFTVFLYGQLGVYRENFSLAWANADNMITANQSGTQDLNLVWSTTNQGGTLPGAAYRDYALENIGNVSNVGSDYLVMRADFLRARNITLGYTFDMETIKKYVKTLRVYVDVQNAFIITKYKGADPEILTPGVKGGAAPYPMVRTFSLGLNATF
jgi:TonB-dependent starch-binding outer membrane protein SusC